MKKDEECVDSKEVDYFAEQLAQLLIRQVEEEELKKQNAEEKGSRK